MITRYIFELLYEHNCVVLPGLGGFIANRQPSKVNEAQQRVEPPRKVVAFNSNLSQNDGLLANHIATKENISFDESVSKCNAFVEQLKTELQLKKHYALNGIGEFYLNSENKIVFVPESDINFAKETFGLFPISIRRIIREQEVSVIPEKTISPRTKPLPLNKPVTVPKTATKRSRKWVYSAALIALPVLAGFLSQQTGLLQKADFNISGIFKHQLPEITAPAKAKNNTTTANTTTSVVTNTPVEAPTITAEPVGPANTNAATTPVAADVSSNANASTTNQFHIIGGSFGVAANAESFIKQLQSKGYQAYIAGTNNTGLSMVSYASFATEAEALAFLQKIKQTESEQAWLYKNNGQ